MTSIRQTMSEPNNIAMLGGAAAGGIGGVAIGSKIGNGIGQDIATALGATAGGKVENVNPFVARVVAAKVARDGHVGGFAARNPGLAAHVGGKVGNAATDSAVTGATRELGEAIGKPVLGETAGKVINTVKHEAVSATSATLVGNATGGAFPKIAMITGGIIGAGIGAMVLAKIVD